MNVHLDQKQLLLICSSKGTLNSSPSATLSRLCLRDTEPRTRPPWHVNVVDAVDPAEVKLG